MAYTLKTIDNPSDLTFNQLLAINDEGQIAGYFGNGTTNPNKGYTVTLQNGAPVFVPENYPLSVQTQVTGINNGGQTVGFEIDAAGNSYGFVDNNGVFSIAVDSAAPKIGGVVTEQFLGVNDRGQVAGFYVTDGNNDTAGFIYNEQTGAFSNVAISGATSVTATDINDEGDVSGFFTAGGKTKGFVDNNGSVVVLAGKAGAGWTDVQALGLNDTGLVVGSYVKGNDTFGFTYNELSGVYTSFSKGAGTDTVINGVNNAGQLVGFYTGADTFTHGMLLTPPTPAFNWQSQTIDNPKDTTFNQLLAINNAGEIAGYFGNGTTNPNQGYTVTVPNAGSPVFTDENYPGSTQTQVTGINNAGVTVGFEVDAAGNSAGWVDQPNGAFQLGLDPNAPTINGVVNEQFLGVNDRNQVAGFYQTDAAGDTAGFIYNDQTGAFSNVAISGATSVTATDINDQGFISGFYTNKAGKTEGFIDENGTIHSIPGGIGDSNVQVLGLNNTGLAVGSFQTSVGGATVTEGFTYSLINGSFQSFIAPGDTGGQTVLNGVNDLDKLTGFYMDSAGNTHGLLVTNATVV
jgi:hypothetical protein